MRLRLLVVLFLIILIYSSSLLFVQDPSNIGKQTYVYTSTVTYINYGEEVQNIDRAFFTFNIFTNSSWQTTYIKTANSPYTLAKDPDKNLIMVFNVSSLPPGGHMMVSYSMSLEERNRTPPIVSFASSGDLSDIPKELRGRYCKVDGTWLVDEDVKQLANTIWTSLNDTTNVLQIASGIADWIGNNIKSVNHDIPYYPSETYRSLEGDCDDQANLLIALCRLRGIPAYLQVGCIKWPSKTETYWGGHLKSVLKDISYHGWAVVYIPPWGWLPLDTSLGWVPNKSLSVITNAKTWSIETIPILNVTEGDWPSEGRAQKAQIVDSSLNIIYYNSLTSQKNIYTALNLHLFTANILIIFFLIITISFYLRRDNKLINRKKLLKGSIVS